MARRKEKEKEEKQRKAKPTQFCVTFDTELKIGLIPTRMHQSMVAFMYSELSTEQDTIYSYYTSLIMYR